MAGLLFRKTFLDVVIVNEEVKKRSKSAPAAMSLGNLLKLPVLLLFFTLVAHMIRFFNAQRSCETGSKSDICKLLDLDHKKNMSRT